MAPKLVASFPSGAHHHEVTPGFQVGRGPAKDGALGSGFLVMARVVAVVRALPLDEVRIDRSFVDVPRVLRAGVEDLVEEARSISIGLDDDVQEAAHAVRVTQIELANGTAYGLGAAVFSGSSRGRALIPKINSGYVALNTFVKSDPRLPFGGIKDSGYGRELSREGLFAFANTKTVWVQS